MGSAYFNYACAPHAIVSPRHRATFSQEEIDMRRGRFFTLMYRSVTLSEGGLYQKKKTRLFRQQTGRRKGRANAGETQHKIAETDGATHRFDRTAV